MAQSRKARPQVEALGDRVLLAAGISLDSGVVRILGTDAADRATVTLAADRVAVTLSGRVGTTRTFDRAGVQLVQFRGLGGNDRFVNATDIPAQAFGGS